MAPKKQRESLQRDGWILNASNEGRTKRKWIEDRGMARTQIWYFAFTLLGVVLVLWDTMNERYELPTIGGANIGAIIAVVPVLALAGEKAIAALAEVVARMKGH